LTYRRYILSPVGQFVRTIPTYLPLYVLIAVVGFAGWMGLEPALVVSPFHLPPESKERPLPFGGETVADTLVDALSVIRKTAQGFPPSAPCNLASADREKFGGLSFLRPVPTFTDFGRATSEIKGLSVSAVIAAAREVLGRETLITGDVVLTGGDGFELTARTRDVGPWSTGIFPVSHQGLRNAACTLAERIMEDTDKNLLSAALIRRTEYQRVIQIYKVMPSDPKDLPDAFNNLGVALIMTKMPDEAQKKLNRAIELQPAFPQAYFNLGNLEADGKHPEVAAADYRKALLLKPDFIEAHNNLATVLDELNDKEGAIAEFREALRLSPEYALAHYNLGTCLYKKRDLVGAEFEFREALRLEPDDPGAHLNLCSVLRGKGDLQHAEAECREAIRLAPEFANGHLGLGNVLNYKSDFKGAMKEYRAAIGLEPNLTDAHVNLAGLLSDRGDHKGAEAEYRLAIKSNEDNPESHFGLGLELEFRGDKSQAIAEYRKAVDLKKDFSEAIQHLKNLEGKP